MKIYIASKYIEHQELNNKIYAELTKAHFDAFLPEKINRSALTCDEMRLVAEICYSEIEQCDVMLVVCPFGKSVASELGYAIALKRTQHGNKKIVVLNPDFHLEAMICPYVDKWCESISEAIGYLNEID